MPAKNDTYFRHLKPGEKDYKLSDSGGLFMLVTKNGSKLWRFGYRFDTKQKLLALGQYPVTSLADARIKRDAAKKLLAEGIDPSVERKEERRNARMARANTFEAVAKELMNKFEAEGDAPTTLKKKQWLLDFANKEFGKRPIAEIKAPEILDALRKIEKRGRHETATRAAQHGWSCVPLWNSHGASRARSDRRSPGRPDHPHRACTGPRLSNQTQWVPCSEPSMVLRVMPSRSRTCGGAPLRSGTALSFTQPSRNALPAAVPVSI